MKIAAEHYKTLKEAIEPLAHMAPAHRDNLLNSAKARTMDIDKRVRWDFCYAAGLSPFICNTIYKYADDSHLDTALRQIQRELRL